jgi:hypothetical protein
MLVMRRIGTQLIEDRKTRAMSAISLLVHSVSH